MNLGVRLTWTGWCGVAAVVVFATLFALPTTRWVVRRQFNFLRGDLKLENYGEAFDEYAFLPRTGPADPRGPRDELVCALLLRDEGARLQALRAVSDRYPADPFVQAELARASSSVCLYREHLATHYHPDNLKLAAQLLTASQRGEKSEPSNAFFPMLAAIAYQAQGHTGLCRDALGRAASKPAYREYLDAERELIVSYMRSHPYAGEYAILTVDEWQRGPYVAPLQRLASDIAAAGTEREQIKTRLSILRLLSRMQDGAEAPRTMAFAISSAKRALYPEAPKRVPYKTTDQQVLGWARQLRQRAGALGIDLGRTDPVAEVQHQLAIAKALRVNEKEEDNRDDPYSPATRILISSAILASFVLVVPVALLFGLGQTWRRNEGAALLLPLALLLLGLVEEMRMESDGWLVAQTVCLGVAAVMAFIPILRKHVRILFGAAVLIGLVAGFWAMSKGDRYFYSHTTGMSIMVAVVWAVSCLRLSPWLVWPLVTLQFLWVAALGGAGYANELFLGFQPGFVYPWLAVVLMCLVGPRRKIAGRRLVGPIVLLGALAYGVSTIQEVAFDQRFRPVIEWRIAAPDRVRNLGAGFQHATSATGSIAQAPRL